MISYLIDFVLLAALVVTSWRAGAMYREVRRLREGGEGLGQALEAADQSINRAAHAVVTLKNEGLRTLQALERGNDEARALSARLEELLARADWHCAGQGRGEAAPAFSQDREAGVIRLRTSPAR